MGQLTGRVAVITGGASGIGLATGRIMAGMGARLVMVDVEPVALDGAIAGLRDDGAEVHGVVCDVSDFDAVQAMADETFSRMGAAHIVFNNAGIAVGGPISEMTHADWKWTIDVDLWGPIHGVEAFLPRMIEQGQGGHLLFTASFAGLVPNEGLGPYCVAKYGVVAMAEVLRRELREHQIGSTVLCPMRVETNIGSSERNRPADLGGPDASPGVEDQGADNEDLSGGVLAVDDVAQMTVDAMLANRPYVLPHEESRGFIRRRFERIDQTFEDQGS